MRFVHGMTGTPTYRSWAHARGRCLNPRDPRYDAYGARGITMCETWAGSFAAFLKDMGERPAGLTLERKDNDKGYEPGNCVWADACAQNQNKRLLPVNKTGHVGVYFHNAHSKYAAQVQRNRAKQHLGLFDDLASAVAARAAYLEKETTNAGR